MLRSILGSIEENYEMMSQDSGWFRVQGLGGSKWHLGVGGFKAYRAREFLTHWEFRLTWAYDLGFGVKAWWCASGLGV